MCCLTLSAFLPTFATTYLVAEGGTPSRRSVEKNKQMPRYFVQVRAIFKDGQFHVTEAIEEPTLDIPQYIKTERKNTKRQPEKKS